MEWMFGEDLPPEQGSPRFDQAIGGWDTSEVKACVEIKGSGGRIRAH